ncbi:hypothetical protein F5877DRAFT_71376 [Lentinula edodes]|nr:hypothetical protein F5877DRAFT_71376 [Lentinula edodes]
MSVKNDGTMPMLRLILHQHLQKLQVKVGRAKKKKKLQKTSTGPIPWATPSKQVTFHIGFYGKTGDLAAGKAKRPTPAEFQFMQYSGHIRAVIINKNASHDDICNAIKLKFDKLLPTTDIARFSLLQILKSGSEGLGGLNPEGDKSKARSKAWQADTESDEESIPYHMMGDKDFEHPWWMLVTKHHEQYQSFALTAARLKLWL